MNKFRLILTPFANQEIANAYIWYESKQKDLGERFIDALDTCFNIIDNNPEIYKKIYKEQRQAILKDFPFVIMYEFYQKQIIIYAIFHTAQNPIKKFR